MKNGFTQELNARNSSLASAKLELENLYGENLEDLKDRPEIIARVDAALRACEAAVTSYTGTLRSIKLSIDSCFEF